MGDLPTLQVRWLTKGQRIVRINAADFDPTQHRRLDEPVPVVESVVVEEPATDEIPVTRRGPGRSRGT